MHLFDIITGAFVAVILGVLGTEVFQWIPRWASRITRYAASTVPERLRSRLQEEWMAELECWPTSLSKLTFSISLLVAARRLRVAKGARIEPSLFFKVCWFYRLRWRMPHARAEMLWGYAATFSAASVGAGTLWWIMGSVPWWYPCMCLPVSLVLAAIHLHYGKRFAAWLKDEPAFRHWCAENPEASHAIGQLGFFPRETAQ
jgi:hypothetical protein